MNYVQAFVFGAVFITDGPEIGINNRPASYLCKFVIATIAEPAIS